MHQIYDPSWGQFPPHIENPRLKLRRTDCAGGSDIAYDGGLLYLISADDRGSLRILDARGDKPVLLGSIGGLGNLRQIEVSADAVPGRKLAAATARECGLYILDVTEPSSPILLCHYNSVEFATGVAFCGQYLFIGCRSFGVEIIDIAQPEKPRHISVIRAGEVQSVTVADGILYTGSWGERQVNVIDVRDLTSPKLLTTIPLEGRGDGLVVRDGLLYAAFGQHLRPASGTDPAEYGYGRGNGFAIWDVSDPASPKQLSTTTFPHRYYCCNWDMWDVTLCTHYAIISHTFNGVWIYDIADPASPKLVDHTAITTDKRPEEIITMNEATLKLRPLILPFDYTKIMYAPVSGVAAADGRLYIAVRFENLHIAEGDYFTAGNESPAPLPPAKGCYYDRYPGDACEGVRIVRTEGQVHAAAYLNGLVWAACGMDGVRVYEPETLRCVGQYPMDTFALDIRAANGLLYIAAGKGGVIIARPEGASLRVLGRCAATGRNVPMRTYSQIVPSANGRFAMVHTDDQRLTIMDVSDPASPKPLMLEHFAPGLIYHRHLSAEGAGGVYYGCYWNGNYTRWYDLSGDTPKRTEWKQGKLGFGGGLTGLAEPYRALVVYGGGYIIHDIREELDYREMTPVRIEGAALHGKPVVRGNLLCVTDRLDGYVTLCDISDPASPRLIRQLNFSGHPDMACPIDGGVILPLGHQGLGFVKV
ncbi:MAG: hypothetical protein IJ493_07990 [Clostridia bacterium]|nr:hypothetical protein [Clostridia bacterium]